MFRDKTSKFASVFASLASASALVSWAQSDVSSSVIGKVKKGQSVHLVQKEATKVVGNSSFLLTFIWYTFLTAAGMYVLGLLDKVSAYVKADMELQLNKDLVKYQEKNGKKLELESELDSEKQSLEKMTEDMDQCKKSVENLKKDPLIEKLKPSIEIIENAKKDEGLMKNLELRQKLLEYWKLTCEWICQNGFRTIYQSFEKISRPLLGSNYEVPTFEELKWLDGEFIAKEEKPLSYPEERLESDLKELQKEKTLFYLSALKEKPLKFCFNSFKGKNIQQLAVEDFNKAQDELISLKQTNINNYNEDKEFKREFDELSEQLKKFQKDFENFKKAQEKLKEIRKLKESFSENLFSDLVEEKIGKIVTAAGEIQAKSLIRFRGFDTDRFELVKIQKHRRYIFTEKDFSEIENFVKEVCCEKDIEDYEQRIEELQRAVEAKNSKIADIKKNIEQTSEKLESKKDAKQRIEYLNKKQNEVMENLFKFTFPGKYTFFY